MSNLGENETISAFIAVSFILSLRRAKFEVQGDRRRVLHTDGTTLLISDIFHPTRSPLYSPLSWEDECRVSAALVDRVLSPPLITFSQCSFSLSLMCQLTTNVTYHWQYHHHHHYDERHST